MALVWKLCDLTVLYFTASAGGLLLHCELKVRLSVLCRIGSCCAFDTLLSASLLLYFHNNWRSDSNLFVWIHLELLWHLRCPKHPNISSWIMKHSWSPACPHSQFPGCPAYTNKQLHYHTRHQRENGNGLFYSFTNNFRNHFWCFLCSSAHKSPVEEGQMSLHASLSWACRHYK